MPAPSAGLAKDFEDCYPDLLRALTRRTGGPDRACEGAHDRCLKLVCGTPAEAEPQCARAHRFTAAQTLVIDHARRHGPIW